MGKTEKLELLSLRRQLTEDRSFQPHERLLHRRQGRGAKEYWIYRAVRKTGTRLEIKLSNSIGSEMLGNACLGVLYHIHVRRIIGEQFS